ncbi:MAG TPA: A/G-specific adenine glycosylase, partial [Terriglobales bacterium]|nr:A/G-specific adenine glycosylase [Terriglobales bacterium]
VSEIMLQQTRVAAVLDHYGRFLRRFANVESLARAREASVLAMWSGLGYYHRARRMHRTAKIIVRERQGKFPRTAREWLDLPGIGRYTAAAILSIAFDEPVAVVDGNVERVLQRLIGGEHNRWEQAQTLLDRKRPGDFNQAIMELGATICTPRAPQCRLCPVISFCETRGAGRATVTAARKRKELRYALARRNDAVLLVRRPASASLMAGMWELPALGAEQTDGYPPLLRLRHSITDTDYRVAVFAIDAKPLQAPNAKWFTWAQCLRLPMTGLARKILRRAALVDNPRQPSGITA